MQSYRSDSNAAVRVTGVTRLLPLGSRQVEILQGISFTIAPGEWVALTGPSGSGKSTLLGILAGIDAPTDGQVVIDGVDITRMDERELARIRNQKIGIVFQSFNLIPNLTAQENVEVPLYVNERAGRRSPAQQARAALERVGLGDRLDHRPHQLSGGEQQRVAIARAIVTRPSLLLADEPTGNLDTRMGEQIMDLFARLRDELGVTLVVVTHDPQIAGRAARALHLVDGRLAEPVTTPSPAPQPFAVRCAAPVPVAPLASDGAPWGKGGRA